VQSEKKKQFWRFAFSFAFLSAVEQQLSH